MGKSWGKGWQSLSFCRPPALAGEMPQDIEEVFEQAGVPLFPQASRDLEDQLLLPGLVQSLQAHRRRFLPARRGIRPRSFSDLQAARPHPGGSSRRPCGRCVPQAQQQMMTVEHPVFLHPPQTGSTSGRMSALLLAGGPRAGFDPGRSRPGPEVEDAMMRRLGDSPFLIGKANLTSLLSKAYGIAGRAARQKAAGELEL